MPLSVLLRSSYALCNRLSRPLVAGVLAFGILTATLQAGTWAQAGVLLMQQMKGMVSTERYAEIERLIAGDATVNAEKIGTALSTELDLKLKSMTQTEQMQYIERLIVGIVSGAGAVLWAFLLGLVALFVFSRSYALTLAALAPKTVIGALRETVRRFPGLAGTWLLMAIASCLWMPGATFLLGFGRPEMFLLTLPSVALPVALYPRFAYAPVIRLQEHLSCMHCVRASFARTRGRWWVSASGLVGLSVSVWLGMTLLRTSLQLLVDSVLPYSFMAMMLYLLVPFLHLAASAFRACGLVTLKQTLAPAAR